MLNNRRLLCLKGDEVMRKSLKSLAVATAMTMLMSTTAYAAPTVADPNVRSPFNTVDAEGTSVSSEVTMFT